MASSRKVTSKVAATMPVEKAPCDFMQPKQLFLAVDWTNQHSIRRYFPIKEGMGQDKDVPLHIIAFDTKYSEVVRKVKQFRDMSTEEQEFERQVRNRLNSSDRRTFKRRLNELVDLQVQMKAEMLENSGLTPAAQQPARSITPPPPSSNVARPRATTAQTDSREPLVPVDPVMPSILREGTSREQLFDMSLRRQSNTRHSSFEHPQPAEESSEAEYVGGFSSPGKRKALVENASIRKRVKPTKGTRQLGHPAKQIAHQTRAAAMTAVHESLVAAATAVDTCYLKDAYDHEPRQIVVQLVLRELEVSKSQGGRCVVKRLAQPELCIVTSSAKDLKRVMTAYKKACKHQQQSSINLQVFLSDQETHKVTPSVKEFIKAYKEYRKPPSTTPRPYADTMGEGDDN